MPSTSTPPETAAHTDDLGERRRNVVYGALATVLIAAALFLLVAGGGPSVDLDSLDAPPLTLEAPVDGSVHHGPLEIVFDPGTHIRQGPRGWGEEPLHIHLVMNRREYMPGRHDVTPLERRRYRWELPPFSPGEYRIQLVWATEDHGSIPHGASEEVTIRIVDGPGEVDPASSPLTPHH